MTLARDINIKPSCLQEIHALPAHMMGQVWEKFNFLAQNPFPDGHLKKKLAKWTDVFRLRIGHYRVFYTFGPNWIRLLGIRQRKDAYQSQDVNYEEPGVVTNQGDGIDLDEDEVLFRGAGHQAAWTPLATAPVGPRTLNSRITVDWLQSLGVPAAYNAAFGNCQTEDDLLNVAAPLTYVDRVVENLFPRPIDEILQQPDYAVFDTQDLVRYKEGELVDFLLRLDPDQEHLIDWALRGPALIKGGPGTGKSTIALYRVRALLDHAEASGRPSPRILFTTYTPSLTRYSEQLLRQLLGERFGQVRVETADDLAKHIVTLHQPVPKVLERSELEPYVIRLLAERQSTLPDQVFRLRPDYLMDEIEWVIQGRDLRTLDQYLEANRAGRGIALNEASRRAVWELYQELESGLVQSGLWTISRVRTRALELTRSGSFGERFDAVLIDEAQDLTPASLSLLVELSRDGTGLYLTADASQSIYYRGFSWQSVHDRLRVRGRALLLRRNYRTTKEIAQAAANFLRSAGAGDPDSLTVTSGQTGPQPYLVGCSDDAQQWDLTADFIQQMARSLRLKTGAAAVLVPSGSLGEQAEAALNARGIKAKFMRGSQLDLQGDEVKIMTLAAAKGLEFPIVAVAGLTGKNFPRLAENLASEERDEELQTARRTLFVGMTRAMRGLMVLYDRENPSPFIAELASQFWSAL